MQLVENQYFDESCSERRPSERPLRVTLENRPTDLRILSQWRPCAPWGGVGESLEHSKDARWCLGEEFNASWVLAVDLYHATGLPPAAAGTQHWVSVELRRRGSEERVALRETPCVEARKPVDRASEVLKVVGEFNNRFPTGGLNADCNWREALGLTDPECAAEDAVDAVWDYPLWFLVPSGGQPVLEAIKGLEIVVVVKRPESSLHRDLSSKRPVDRIIGQQTWRLAELVSTDHYSQRVVLPVPTGVEGHKTVTSVASLSMRLHVRPLQVAPVLREDQAWDKIRQVRNWGANVIARAGKRSVYFAEGARALVRQYTSDKFGGRTNQMNTFGAVEDLDSGEATPSCAATPYSEFESPLCKRPTTPGAGAQAAVPRTDRPPGLSEAVRLDLDAAAAEQSRLRKGSAPAD